MRSNSLDFSSFETMNLPDAHKKTERSHEENQERAYIAASRRTDRSLEARVQSARMASEIHKRRTGKSFRISEEIVLKEEMYEEEDDDLPRSYRILGPNMQTGSAEMNYRVDAFLSNKVAMSAMLARTNDEWRQNEVNKLFDQMFPNACYNSQRAAASRNSPGAQQPQPQQQQMPQPQQQQQQQQHMPQQFQQMQPQPQQQHPNYAQAQQYYGQASPHHARTFSTPTPAHCPPPTEFVRQDSGVGLPTSPTSFGNSPQPDSPIDLGSSRSAFTSELPPEARMMMGDAGMNPGFDHTLQNWASMDASFDMTEFAHGVKGAPEPIISPTSDTFDMGDIKWDQLVQPMDDTTWNTFINDSAWANDQ